MKKQSQPQSVIPSNSDEGSINQPFLDVSVIICAYTEERWEALVAAVKSVQGQVPPPLEVIIVIDHNPSLFTHAQTGLVGVKVIENKGRQGLSGARNSGIAIARGRLVAFLDDDAIAEPDWLARLSYWCDQPQVLGAGGRVEPFWLTSRPAWFPDEFGWVIGCAYRGLPQTARPVRNVFGGCMCVRREVFQKCGGFRGEIGRLNAIPLGCEETELCIRARRYWPQSVFIHEPQAVIHHQVPEDRVRWSYFYRRCFNEGVSKAIVSEFVGLTDGLASERVHALHVLPQGVIRNLKDTIQHHNVAGLIRAGAIIAGLAFTVAGYIITFISLGLWRKKQPKAETSTDENSEPLGQTLIR